MKAWGWISTRRSLEDVVKNAFEETIMKNVPIDQFWSFKWRNGVQNWNLREKLSKIGPVGNFDFGQRSTQKSQSQSQSQLVQGQSQQMLVRVGSGFPGRVTGRAVDPLTSSYDVSMMWTRADVDMLAWLLTWTNDVIRWRQMTSAAEFGACQARAQFTGAWRSSHKSRWRVEARATSVESHISSVSRSVVGKAVMAARVHENDQEVREPEAAGGSFPETTEARGGAWHGFRWSDFWVFLTGDRGARLCGWFLQAKAWFAQICKVSGSTCLRYQRCSSEATTEFPWELRDAVDPDLKEGMSTVVDLCYAHENLLCLLEILFDAKNKVWLWYHVE